jgi:lipopolysaccharide/colanic/teichoic acid biosynthesis glycosyltransferase
MKPRYLPRWILLADLCWALVAFALAVLLRYGFTWSSEDVASAYRLLPFLGATWFLWMILSSWMKLDCFSGGWRFPAVLSQVFLAVSCLMVFQLGVGYLARQFVSRLALTYFGILVYLGFVGIRYIANLILRKRCRAGSVRKVVIVGTGRVARELAVKIQRHPEMLCKVAGFLFQEEDGAQWTGTAETTMTATTVSTLGVIDLLCVQQIDELILASAKPAGPEILNLAGQCRERGINVSFVPNPYELYLSKLDLFDLDGLPLLQLQDPKHSYAFWGSWKRATDIVFGLILLILCLPILVPACIVLRLRKGVALRGEIRCGLHGKAFSMLRMNVDRPCTEPNRFLCLLEELSLTEVPQLWNVIRGEMAMVGPRPESPQRVRYYSDWQRQRLTVKPGITGLAQVHGLREQHSSEEKTRFDLQYLLNPSPIADISLLMQTVWTIFIRLLRRPRLSMSATPVPASTETSPLFMQESLQGAHRSQSSAD